MMFWTKTPVILSSKTHWPWAPFTWHCSYWYTSAHPSLWLAPITRLPSWLYHNIVWCPQIIATSLPRPGTVSVESTAFLEASHHYPFYKWDTPVCKVNQCNCITLVSGATPSVEPCDKNQHTLPLHHFLTMLYHHFHTGNITVLKL